MAMCRYRLMMAMIGIQSWIHRANSRYLPVMAMPAGPSAMVKAINGVMAKISPSKKVIMGRTMRVKSVCSAAHWALRCWAACSVVAASAHWPMSSWVCTMPFSRNPTMAAMTM